MKWTKEQQEAIELRGKNILVSAAAGSGKTAVLVERIKRLILEDSCSVDRMLIVTFTNAAASEMKEKIRKSLSDILDEAEGRDDTWAADESLEKRVFLKKQVELLGTANISTFHSFALEVIRRYFYIIDVEPNFKICDSTQESLLKGEAMDQLLEELFEKAEPDFFRFLKSYSGDRDESRFRKMISECYDTLRSLPEPFKWLDENVEQLKDGRSFEEGNAGHQLFEAAAERIERGINSININSALAESCDLPLLEALCRDDRKQF